MSIDLVTGATGLMGGNLVRALVARYPTLKPRLFDRTGKIHRHINALRNGGNVSYRKGFDTPLADGDLVALLPPVGGG